MAGRNPPRRMPGRRASLTLEQQATSLFGRAMAGGSAEERIGLIIDSFQKHALQANDSRAVKLANLVNSNAGAFAAALGGKIRVKSGVRSGTSEKVISRAEFFASKLCDGNAVSAFSQAMARAGTAQAFATGLGSNIASFIRGLGPNSKAFFSGLGVQVQNFALGAGANSKFIGAGIASFPKDFAAGLGANSGLFASGLGANAGSFAEGLALGRYGADFLAALGDNIGAFASGLGSNAKTFRRGLGGRAREFATALGKSGVKRKTIRALTGKIVVGRKRPSKLWKLFKKWP